MGECNPLECLQGPCWSVYDKPASEIQIASGLLLLISAVSLAIILSLPQNGVYIAANAPACITLYGVGGVSFTTFILASCTRFLALRQMKTEAANVNRLIDLPIEEEPVVVEVTVTLEEQPVEYIKQVLLQPILHSFDGALKGTVVADSVKTSRNIDDKLEKVEWAINEAEELFCSFLDSPQIYVTELLRCYGPGKKPLSVALRRMIAAYNSGDAQLLDAMTKEYRAIASGHDFSDIQQALRNKTNDEILRDFPALLENHFCLANPPLKEMGGIVLGYLFERVRAKPKVMTALEQLRKAASSKELPPEEIEKFLKIVLHEADVQREKYDEWNQDLIKRMLETSFKKTLCNSLNMMALNMRLLRLLFDKQQDKKELFITIDETFLISESTDCIGNRHELQKDIYHAQSVINYNRPEKKRLALIVLNEGDARNYEELCTQDQVFKLCFEAHASDPKELNQINVSEAIAALNRKHHVRIVAVPVSISDHPFKTVKNYEGTIRFAASLLKPFLPPLVKPFLLNLLPRMENAQLQRFDKLFETFLSLLIDPIYDGAIGITDFRPVFERVITTKGEELANAIEGLLHEKDLNFEKIRDVWTTAVRGIAEEFMNEGRT